MDFVVVRNRKCPAALLAVVLSGVIGVSIFAGCAGPTRLDSMDSGRSVSYAPGVPNFDMEAISTIREGRSGVDLYLSIPMLSLIFKRGEQGFEANFEVLVQARDRRGRDVISQETWRDTVLTATYDRTQHFEFLDVNRRFSLEPGEYVVEATLRDLNSEERAVRRQRIEVLPPQPAVAAISRVRLESRDDSGEPKPILALHVPQNVDSLQAVVELYPGEAVSAVEVRMTLTRFLSDRSVATLPYWLSPNIGSLAYRGINFDRADTLQITRRLLHDTQEKVEIAFTLPQLEQGNYRIGVEGMLVGEGTGLESEYIVSGYRDLSIKGYDFPRVSTLNELVEPLAYVAYERELREIKAAETPAEMRSRFDAFWGNLVGNRDVAANLVRTYYARVEEANMMFSTHKEGWKTDRGMVYIVLGAPLFVERMFETETWHYSYTDRDAESTFVFQRVRPTNPDVVFDNFILVRRPFLERTWLRAVDRWRSGAVL